MTTRTHACATEVPCSSVSKWPDNTVLITGDSYIKNIYSNNDDSKNTDYYNSKCHIEVRPYPGALIDDMYDYLKPLLRRRPSHVILHVGYHDTTNTAKTADVILHELINLKTFIETLVVGIRVSVSCPVVRVDDDVADAKTLQIRQELKVTYENDCISNENISHADVREDSVRRLGPRATHILRANILGFIRRVYFNSRSLSV